MKKKLGTINVSISKISLIDKKDNSKIAISRVLSSEKLSELKLERKIYVETLNPEQWLDDVAVDSILSMASKNSFLNKLYVQVSVLMAAFYREVQFYGIDGYIPI